jgi:UDP-N-acetylmuramoyl-L-alanyl-D-glutamate--2,6-diaminopimelate ligase
MVYLNNILPKTGILGGKGPDNAAISSITSDSRNVQKDSLFFAIPGLQTDGHQYIANAIEKGASAVVCENLPKTVPGNICFVVVEDSSKAMGEMASAYYDFPSAKLKLVGVTGTNGKTTSVFLLYRLFRDMGHKVGLISTVKYMIHNQELEATHTTPDSISLNKLLSQMVREGCEYCFMEVSSHAVNQKRIAGLNYTGGVFTNITHDHLDYHKTFDDYLAAKKSFFDQLDENAFALVNIDDKRGRVMVQNTKARVKTYSMLAMAEFKVRTIESHFDGMMLQMDNKEVWSRLIGEFNAYNLAAIYGTAVLLGKNPNDILPLLSTYQSVDGRFEYLKSADGALAIIDYAHTPDALSNVLKTIQQLRQPGGQVITLVGAGGNRDKTKRPVMAKVAVTNSDKLILTSDNPRNENPDDILADMMAGVDENDKWRVLVITNRKEAIKTACTLLSAGDILLVAGKGHETYQEINGVRTHFSDKEEVQHAFKTRNKK